LLGEKSPSLKPIDIKNDVAVTKAHYVTIFIRISKQLRCKSYYF